MRRNNTQLKQRPSKEGLFYDDNKKPVVAIFCGGRSAEHHISLNSAKSVIQHIDRKLFEPLLVQISPDGFFDAVEDINDIGKSFPCAHKRVVDSFCDLITKYRISIAFIAMHGPFGEDGSIQGLCETLKIPYVGSGVLGSAVALDKAVFKLAIKGAGIPTAKFQITYLADWKKSQKSLIKKLIDDPGLPLMIKPSTLGSSIGISKASDRPSLALALKEAFRFDDKVLVEEFLVGREIECAVLGYGDKMELLSTAEIVTEREFYDLEAKYEEGLTDIIVPAKISKKDEKLLKETAWQACRAIEADGFSRIDMFLVKRPVAQEKARARARAKDAAKDAQLRSSAKGSSGQQFENVAYINEINTIPGFTNTSVYPLQAKDAGLSYKKLITSIIRTAQAEHKDKNVRFKETRDFIKSRLK